MTTSILIKVMMTIAALSLAVHTESIVIKTQLGQIQGTVHKVKDQQTVYSFKGIHYAISPIGSLRFRPSSVNESKWNGIYNATTYGSTCLQQGVSNEHQPQSEDCLFLNIF
eukprot:490777_1